MNTRNVAVVVFYDKKGNIAVQERGAQSKGEGEIFGFWGGKIEKGETKEQALKRELLEELGYSPKDLIYWDNFPYTYQQKGKYEGWHINQHIFLSPITPRLLKSEIHEGSSIVILKLRDATKGGGFPKDSVDFLRNLKRKLKVVPDKVY